jgi:hypothetical protein
VYAVNRPQDKRTKKEEAKEGERNKERMSR